MKLLQIELYKISKRPRTYIAFAAITAIVLIFQIAFLADGKSYMDLMLQSAGDTFTVDKGKAINGYFMCYIILNTLLIQVPILVALIAGDSISGEANMGTLRLLLTKPVSRTQLILVKFLASLIYTVGLLIWMAVMALFLSMALFGTEDMLIFRSNGGESEILQITKDDVLRVAKQYVTVDNLDIVIVGDRSVIEGPLKATKIAPIALYDIEGNPAGASSAQHP